MEVMPLPGKPAATRQRTITVTPVVRGFKIDGDEGGRGPRCALGGGRVRNCAGRHWGMGCASVMQRGQS